MEDNSASVAVGKQVDRHSYARRARKWTQLDLGHLKIDHFDPVARVVKETKKSSKLEHVHVAQVKYYLRALELRGVLGVTGLLEYPRPATDDQSGTNRRRPGTNHSRLGRWRSSGLRGWNACPGGRAEGLLQELCVLRFLLLLTLGGDPPPPPRSLSLPCTGVRAPKCLR